MDSSEALEILVRKFTEKNKINFVEDERIKNKLFSEELCEYIRDNRGRTELLTEEYGSSDDDDAVSGNSTIYLPELTEKAKEIGSNYIFLNFSGDYVYATPLRIISYVEKKQILEMVYKNPKELLEPMNALGFLEAGINQENYIRYMNDVEEFKKDVLELGSININKDIFKSRVENGFIYSRISEIYKEKIYLLKTLYYDENFSNLFVQAEHNIVLSNNQKPELYLEVEKNKLEPIDYDFIIKSGTNAKNKKIGIKTDLAYFNTSNESEKNEETSIHINNGGDKKLFAKENILIKKKIIEQENLNFLNFALKLTPQKQNPEANKLIIKYASDLVDYKSFMIKTYLRNKELFREYFDELGQDAKDNVVQKINELKPKQRNYEFDMFMLQEGYDIELKHDILYNEKDGLNEFKKYFKKSDDKELIIKDILSITDENKKNSEIDNWLSSNYSDLINKVGRINIPNQENGKE